MVIRESIVEDIAQIQVVRNAVQENRLSDPGLVTDADCGEYLTERGRGWVCETGPRIVGFCIVDVKGHNIWALFVHPDYERRGIGRRLHDVMLDWYFELTSTPVWLGTAPHTRAEEFYRRAGWREIGRHGAGEIKFEMSFDDWQKRRAEVE
ncbi:GNAT family N-acetyltransferase [Siphonobacter aquaeclarae]|uniref:Ribosomal protein S18 acetylase RimI n=1 Tax=Siphonobacter aquaeclarae TaxID=563176 RepID=A0A1G9ITT3_9BACT|nr:GNAT family N-acetyltransferase [Siphonobacter aquaeclarae]SDL28343.1 Ribosomal protein S18 acetylase RimI [Siphonobacter aquaeclarae]